MSTRCTATTRAGNPCKAWAVRGSDPPRCAAHGGGGRPVGPPDGNANAQTHGFYSESGIHLTTIEGVIEDLAFKQAMLSDFIEQQIVHNPESIELEVLARLLALHGQNASRLGRLLRDQRALSGDAADGIAGAIAQALDEISSELGVEL